MLSHSLLSTVFVRSLLVFGVLGALGGCASPEEEETLSEGQDALTGASFIGKVYVHGSSRLELRGEAAPDPDDAAAGYKTCKHAGTRECVWQHYVERRTRKEFLGIWFDGNLDRNEVLEGGKKLLMDGGPEFYTLETSARLTPRACTRDSAPGGKAIVREGGPRPTTDELVAFRDASPELGISPKVHSTGIGLSCLGGSGVAVLLDTENAADVDAILARAQNALTRAPAGKTIEIGVTVRPRPHL